MPIVTIQITREGSGPDRAAATAEEKAALIHGVSQLLADVLNKRLDTTHVVIEEVEMENWGLGGMPVADYRRQRAAGEAKPAAGSARNEVAAALRDYFNGLYFGDTVRLRRVLHPRAHYVCATDGALLYRTLDEYLPIVDARPSPASQNEPRRDRILSIQFAGPVTAFARVQCAIGAKLFTDFLTMVRLDGDWRIISKVFHFDMVAGA